MIPPHHVVTLSTGSTTPATTEYASSSTSSRASSPRSSSQIDHSIQDGPSPRLSSELGAYSDLSYDSSHSQEGGGAIVSRRGGGGGGGGGAISQVGQLQTPLTTTSALSTSTSLLTGTAWSGDDYSSRVSSRAASPVPGGGGLGLTGTTTTTTGSTTTGDGGYDGYLAYRASAHSSGGLRSNARSRNVSGFSTPTTPAEEKESYDTDYYDSHHHQTSALLHKLSGATTSQTQTPDTSPIIGRSKQQKQEQRKPGWWSRRAAAEGGGGSRRKPTLSSSSFSSTAPLLPHSRSSRDKHHYRDSSSTSSTSSLHPSSSPKTRLSQTLHYILSQPYVPTQPLTILFSILLFLCFAATLTTFLLNVLSSDREPLPWRQFCQEQRPFPHSLADSLKPVNVFIGVFSVDAAIDRRNAIRLSYAKHSLPLDPLTGKPSTNIQLKFVLGKPREKWSKRVGLEMEMFNDIVVLDTGENMNKGKTFEFFKWANENATVPVYYAKKEKEGRKGKREVGVGFKKVDYVVKADDDAFIVLSELERHLRLTPRENTYWGYLIRNRFMGGEVYALSSDLVRYLATYPRPSSWSIGKEDQRVAKWMRNHPNASSIHWITERCYIYDHPKSGTTYSRGFTFPDHVEQVRLEGRRGISEDERMRRGGELWQSYSTVQSWKKPFSLPAKGLSVEEQVEALVEGGGRWKGQGWRSDNGRGPKAVKFEAVVFEKGDKRLLDHGNGGVSAMEDTGDSSMGTGVKPGVPDEKETLPSARTTRFGKDLFRDPEGVEAVHLRLRKRAAEGGIQEGPTRAPLLEDEYEIYNLVKGGPFEQDEAKFHSANFIESLHHYPPHPQSTSSSALALNSSTTSSPLPPTHEPENAVPINEPTGQIRLGHHAYTLPYTEERFIPYPTLRYDPTTLSIRNQRMLGLPHGGTVAVHYLKRNEWFYETALALLGREKMWDHGEGSITPAQQISTSSYSMDQFEFSEIPSILSSSSFDGDDDDDDPEEFQVETLPASLWGSIRMYGSPIVQEDGMIVEGRRAEAHREIMGTASGSRGGRLVGGRPPRVVPVESGSSNEGSGSWAGRFGRATGGGRPGMLNLAEMDGVEIKVGGDEEEEKKAAVEEVRTPLIVVDSEEEQVEIPTTSNDDSTTTSSLST